MIGEDSFGVWLGRSRKSLGLTQKQLASQLHCATITLRKIEAEQRRPSLQIAEKLAQIFDIPISEQRLFLDFARGDWQSIPSVKLRKYPWRSHNIPTNFQVPSPLTSIIGREQDISTIINHFTKANTRLVTLSGPPGIGKTRLSLDIAHRMQAFFPDGVYFISLAPLNHPNQLVQTILLTLGYKLNQEKLPEDILISSITNRRQLIILDNAEHLVDYAGQLSLKLLRACPNLKIMLTSRETLRTPGEKVITLSTLNFPMESELSTLKVDQVSQFSALELFEERAQAIRPDFSITPDNIKDIAVICKFLDGLPLAIELLAARINIMTPHALLDHLNNHLVLHTESTRTLLPHQKTLYEAIDWSYQLLTPQEKHVFNYLSVFSGGFTIQSVEVIFADSPDCPNAPEIISSLVEKSLFQRTVDDFGEPRFYMLTIIQQFASEQLTLLGEEDSAKEHLQAFCVNNSLLALNNVNNLIQAEGIKHLEVEQDNLRSALNWSISRQKTQSALILLTMLAWIWVSHSNYCEMDCWFEQVHSLLDIHDHPKEYAELLIPIDKLKFASNG